MCIEWLLHQLAMLLLCRMLLLVMAHRCLLLMPLLRQVLNLNKTLALLLGTNVGMMPRHTWPQCLLLFVWIHLHECSFPSHELAGAMLLRIRLGLCLRYAAEHSRNWSAHLGMLLLPVGHHSGVHHVNQAYV